MLPIFSTFQSGWITEASMNPFTRQNLAPDRIMQRSASVATTNLSSQIPVASSTISGNFSSTSVSPYLPSQANNIFPVKPSPPLTHSSVNVRTPSSDVGLAMRKNLITSNVSSVNLPGAHSPLVMRVDAMSNHVKPVANLSLQEGLSNSFPPTASHSATHQQRHPHMPHQAQFTEPSYRNPVHSYPPQIEKSGPVSDLWRVRQEDISSSYHSQRNQNNYNTSVGGSMQSGSWDRNNRGREGYETWSPENSPTRNPRSVPGRNYPESRMNNNVRNNRPEWSRQRGSSGHWDPGRHENRKWHDQRRC